MEARLLNYWGKQALRVQRHRLIAQAQAVRIGMAENNSYNQTINELRHPVSRKEKEQRIRDNWAALKAQGGG